MRSSLVLLGFLLLPLSAAAFTDVPPDHETFGAIGYLRASGILQGYPDRSFLPAAPINRAELLKVLVTAAGIDPPAAEYARCFPDVTDEWFARYVCFAAMQGWVSGYPDGLFRPEQSVSFAETLKMMMNVRGWPPAPDEESRKRGINPADWFAPYLTTSLLLDVVSFDQVWGQAALPLGGALTRATVAEFLYRSLLVESAVRLPLATAECAVIPVAIEITTRSDMRQEVRAVDDASRSCVLSTDINVFRRVTRAFDAVSLRAYPHQDDTRTGVVRIPLQNGRTVLRAGAGQTFRPEVFLVDVSAGMLVQLPSIFASAQGSIESDDGRFVVYVGSTGRTIETLDLATGEHVVVDAVLPPFTFTDIAFPLPGSHAITYVLFHAESGISEPRTADLDEAVNPSSFST